MAELDGLTIHVIFPEALIRLAPASGCRIVDFEDRDPIERLSLTKHRIMAENATKQPTTTFVGTTKIVQTDYPVRSPQLGLQWLWLTSRI